MGRCVLFFIGTVGNYFHDLVNITIQRLSDFQQHSCCQIFPFIHDFIISHLAVFGTFFLCGIALKMLSNLSKE